MKVPYRKRTSHPHDSSKVALTARDVRWDWSGLPIHYLGGDPVATHVVNGINLLLPEGEVFFVDAFQQALPLIKDDTVREDVVGFIGQEATHSSSHQSLLDHQQSVGLDVEAYTEQIRWFFRKIMGNRELTGRRARAWLIERIAVVAAIEHFTSWLGDWGLNNAAWKTEMQPRVLDLVLWHLAEEVEHRHVAFDLFTHLDGSYWRRVRAWLVASPVLALLWIRGTRYLMSIDPSLPENKRKIRLRDICRVWRRSLIFSPSEIAQMWVQYLRPSYHPRNYGSTSQAVAYLATSPAARAAG